MSDPTNKDPQVSAAMAALERELRGAANPLSEEHARAFIELQKEADGDPLGSFTLPQDDLRAVSGEVAPAALRDPLVEGRRHVPAPGEDADPRLAALFDQDPTRWGRPEAPARAATAPQGPPRVEAPSPHSDAALPCDRCGAAFVSGLPFCARCGGEPRLSGAQDQELALVVRGFKGEQARRRFARWIAEAGCERALSQALSQRPPAVFLWRGPWRLAEPLEQWLHDAGVEAQVSPVSAAEGHRLRQHWRQVRAQPTWIAAAVATAAVTLILALASTPCWLVMGAFAIGLMGWGAARQQDARVQVDANRLWTQLSGLSAPLLLRARRLLQELHGQQTRRAFSAGLTHYAALVQHTRALGDQPDAAGALQEGWLPDLMTQLILLTERIHDLDAYLKESPPEALEATLRAQLAAHSAAADPRERRRLEEAVAQLQQQQGLLAELGRSRDALQGRLVQLTGRMEALRGRALAISLKQLHERQRDDQLEEAMSELKAELEIMEEALHEVEALR